MTTELVTRPLTQSLRSDLACPAGYTAKHLRGIRSANTEPQLRGIEIHRAIALYINRLVETKRTTDYDFLRGLVAGVGDEAAEVLESFLESYTFDPAKVAGVELRLSVDAAFNPLDPIHEEPAEFSGGLDLLSFLSPTEAAIDDWKSYYQIVDADTFQAKLYALLVFCHFPAIEKVTFTLRFPRYGTASRSVEFTRDDVSKLKAVVLRERARQIAIERLAEDPNATLQAAPGRHCYGCPLMGPSCPVAQSNPSVLIDAQDRVAFGVWLEEAKKANDAALKDAVIANGPAYWSDTNGTVYEADFAGVVKRSYPLNAAVAILDSWKVSAGEDLGAKLTVSGLSAPLKAQKRRILAADLAAIAVERGESHFKIRRLDEGQEEE